MGKTERGAWGSEGGCEMDAGIKCQNQPSWEESICKGARPCLLRMSYEPGLGEGRGESGKLPEKQRQ